MNIDKAIEELRKVLKEYEEHKKDFLGKSDLRRDVLVCTIFPYAYEGTDPEPTNETVIEYVTADDIADYDWHVLGHEAVKGD